MVPGVAPKQKKGMEMPQSRIFLSVDNIIYYPFGEAKTQMRSIKSGQAMGRLGRR